MIFLSDEEAMKQFESGSLPNESFHHSDHVRMAFLYLRRFSVLQAIERFSAALGSLAVANGKPQLYNETVTWAFLLLIRERIARAEHPPTWEQFVEQNPDLMTWKNSILNQYYREDTLKSDLARRVFLLPDLISS